MHLLKHLALVLITLTLCACGNGGKGHSGNGGSKPPTGETPTAQEFGDVVTRLVQQQDDTSEPEDITPDTWSYHVNENEAAFDHLF